MSFGSVEFGFGPGGRASVACGEALVCGEGCARIGRDDAIIKEPMAYVTTFIQDRGYVHVLAGQPNRRLITQDTFAKQMLSRAS